MPLNARTFEIRQAALHTLEKVYESNSPEANLLALQSTHADIRRLALIRLFQRKMLDDSHVKAILRWRTEDEDAEVRRTAFLLTLSVATQALEAPA